MTQAVLRPVEFETVVLGAGPAGTGLLVRTAQSGDLDRWLETGVLWADSGPRMGVGSLGRYAIASDTMASILLEGLTGDENPLRPILAEPIGQAVAAYGSEPLSLGVAACLYSRLGDHLERLIANSGASAFWPGHHAEHLARQADGRFLVTFSGGRQALARTVVSAMGGHQDRADALASEIVPGLALADVELPYVAVSRELFEHGGLAPVAARIADLGRAPRVVIIGSSHSALCTADLLLDPALGLPFRSGGVRMLCRRMPKVFYPSVDAALADGYTDFDDDDVCPATGRLFRLSGARMASRSLLQSVLGVGGRPQERRVQLTRLGTLERHELVGMLEHADLVVPAFGYRPNRLPLRDASGHLIQLSDGASPAAPLVDARCRILDAEGQPVPGLFGIGLASGYVPRGAEVGGEPSFRGQTNGLWLYQHDLARVLLREAGLLGSVEDHARSAVGGAAADIGRG